MLGQKRKQSSRSKSGAAKNPNNFKPKSFASKSKASSRKRKEDEEIISDSDPEINNNSDISNDDFFEKENDKENNNKISESADTKRLRLARTLISNIEGKIMKDNIIDSKNNDEYTNGNISNAQKRDLVDDYLKNEFNKENNEFKYELAKKINPINAVFLKGHKASVTQVDISSDSKWAISASKDLRAIKWDLHTQKKFLLPQFAKKPLLACMFAPDDKNAFFAGADRHIYQVDIHNEKLIQSFKAHNDTVTGMVFDPNGEQYYSIGNDKKLNVWGISPTQKSILLETFYGHTNKITDLDILISNKVISCGVDSLLNLWKIDTQSFLKFQSTDSFSSLIDNMRTLNPSTFLTGAYDGTVSVWKTNKKKPQNKVVHAHGYSKEFTPQHDFFSNDENFLDFENNLLDYDQKKKFLNRDGNENEDNFGGVKNIKIPNPICSLETVKNSDLAFSGSLNGFVNAYRCFEGNKIEVVKSFEVNKGCVNSIKVNKTNEFMVVGYGKDQKLGRWFTDNQAKTGISIVKLFNDE
jgi:ribosomal RNA-processing protein 9